MLAFKKRLLNTVADQKVKKIYLFLNDGETCPCLYVHRITQYFTSIELEIEKVKMKVCHLNKWAVENMKAISRIQPGRGF